MEMAKQKLLLILSITWLHHTCRTLSEEIRVMTFNVGTFNRKIRWDERKEYISHVVEFNDVDFVAWQDLEKRDDNGDTKEELKRFMPKDFTHFVVEVTGETSHTEARYIGFSSRLHVLAKKENKVHVGPSKVRAYLTLTLRLPSGGIMTMIVAHFPEERSEQMLMARKIQTRSVRLPKPQVLLGDFNDQSGENEYEDLNAMQLLSHHITVSGECVDLSDHCSTWAQRDQCDQNPNYMHKHCAKSCNMCKKLGRDSVLFSDAWLAMNPYDGHSTGFTFPATEDASKKSTEPHRPDQIHLRGPGVTLTRVKVADMPEELEEYVTETSMLSHRAVVADINVWSQEAILKWEKDEYEAWHKIDQLQQKLAEAREDHREATIEASVALDAVEELHAIKHQLKAAEEEMDLEEQMTKSLEHQRKMDFIHDTIAKSRRETAEAKATVSSLNTKAAKAAVRAGDLMATLQDLNLRVAEKKAHLKSDARTKASQYEMEEEELRQQAEHALEARRMAAKYGGGAGREKAPAGRAAEGDDPTTVLHAWHRILKIEAVAGIGVVLIAFAAVCVWRRRSTCDDGGFLLPTEMRRVRKGS